MALNVKQVIWFKLTLLLIIICNSVSFNGTTMARKGDFNNIHESQGTNVTAHYESERKHLRSYYNCLTRQNETLMKYGQLSNNIVRAYIGSVATLPCLLCVSPVKISELVWFYAESITNLSFNIMKSKENCIISKVLTIYYVRQEDAGVYRCTLGGVSGGLVIMEVTNDEHYNVVKPLSSHGPYPTRAEKIGNHFIAYTTWTPWTECSKWNIVGRRRKFGVCYITLIDDEIWRKEQNITRDLLNEAILKLFHAFPKGIPCRSKLLPPSIKDMERVRSRNNEIMIGLCKIPCQEEIFEIHSTSGEILESANNSAGVYSLSQNKPLQPPPIETIITFVPPTTDISVQCPGTTLRDIPVTWRVGSVVISPRELDRATRGRVYFNARDCIVLNNIEYADSNVYSCWQNDILAGIVKLEVRRSAEEIARHRFILVTAIITVCLLLRFTRRLLHHQQRY